MLTQDQADLFLRDGYVVVPEAFAPETAQRFLPYVWGRLGPVTADRRTWTRPGVQVEDVITDGPIDDLLTPRFRASVDDLVGAGRWFTTHGIGWVILRLPGFHAAPWQPPASGWHVDGMDFQHHLTSPQQGLVGIEMLTDIAPGGGGTAVRVGSHTVVSRLLHEAEPDGLSYPQLRGIAEAIRDSPVVEVTGRAGDVLWMHPHTVHARSANIGDRPRIAANRCIALHAPMLLERPNDADHSLVERAVRIAIGLQPGPSPKVDPADHHGIRRPRWSRN